jgi:hypothetical protein
MSGARTVDYIFRLIDQFGPVAAQLARAAQNAEKTIAGMGRASVAVEKSQRGAAAAIQAMNQRTLAANPALQNATERLRAYGAAGERAAAQVRTLSQAQLALTKLQKEAALQRSFGGATGPMTRGDWQGRAIGHAGAAMMAGYVSDTISNGVSHFLDKANDQVLAKQKMKLNAFTDAQLAQADGVAQKLSGKYKNLSKGDILEQVYEGLSIHGTPELAIKEVEMQTRLASFLQGFEGGKHAGNTAAWTRETFAAIKSMEMFGVLNEKDEGKKHHEIEQYLGAMMAQKALYGDQAKLTEYLTLQKRAGTSFRAFNENFRLNVLPALVQEVGGSTTGQQAMTGYQNIVAGVKLKDKTKKMLKHYGMYDAKNQKWAKEAGDLYSDDPTRFVEYLINKAAKVHGLDVKDPELIKKLRRDLPSLLPDRNASSFIDNLFSNSANIHKHIEQMKITREEMDKIAKGEFFAARTKGGAEGSVAAQWKNMMASVGEPMLQPYIDRMNAWGTSLNWVSEAVNNFSKSNPHLAGMIGKGAVLGVGTLATVAMAASVGFGMAAIRAGMGFLFAGGAMGGGSAAVARAAMMGAPLAMGYGGMAMAGGAVTAGAVVARTGLMTRLLGGLVTALTFGAIGVNKFHLAANGMGTGLAFAGRILRTTLLKFGLSIAWMNRDKIGSVGSYLTTALKDIAEVIESVHKHRLGSKERKGATKQFLKNAMGVDLTKISVPDVLGAPEAIFEKLRKGMRDSGWGSYLAWQLYGDKFRMPYGVRPEMNKMVGKMGGLGTAISEGDLFYSDPLSRGSLAKYEKTLSSQLPVGQGFGGFNAYGGYAIAPIPTNAARPQIMTDDVLNELQREISVRSMIDVTIPPSIAIQVMGSLSGSVSDLRGSVTGSSTAPIHAAPRGESSPVDAMGNTF